jgi:hypothetical protein
MAEDNSYLVVRHNFTVDSVDSAGDKGLEDGWSIISHEVRDEEQDPIDSVHSAPPLPPHGFVPGSPAQEDKGRLGSYLEWSFIAGGGKSWVEISKGVEKVQTKEQQLEEEQGKRQQLEEEGEEFQVQLEAQQLDRAIKLSVLLGKLNSPVNRELVCKLAQNGVYHAASGRQFTLHYDGEVEAKGDCLFLSLDTIFRGAGMRGGPQNIREAGIRTFYKRFCEMPTSDRDRTEKAISNLYWPAVEGQYSMSRTKSRRLVARRADYPQLQEKIRLLVEQGLPNDTAREIVYTQCAEPIQTAKAWCTYMKIGNSSGSEAPEHFIITLHYSSEGLFAIDDHLSAIAWGDDFVLEALSDCYNRELFVILLAHDSMFFLPHSPSNANNGAAPQAPLFLLMRTDDHYEPMKAEDMDKEQQQQYEACAVLD